MWCSSGVYSLQIWPETALCNSSMTGDIQQSTPFKTIFGCTKAILYGLQCKIVPHLPGMLGLGRHAKHKGVHDPNPSRAMTCDHDQVKTARRRKWSADGSNHPSICSLKSFRDAALTLTWFTYCRDAHQDLEHMMIQNIELHTCLRVGG